MSKKLIVIVVMFFSLFSIFGDSALKDDENVWFFPTSANQLSNDNWNVPVHHWVFEKEEKSISRKITQSVLSEVIESLGISEEEANSPIFKQRLMWFLVDNERNKQINIQLNKSSKTLNRTEANGHAKTNLSFKCSKKQVNG